MKDLYSAMRRKLRRSHRPHGDDADDDADDDDDDDDGEGRGSGSDVVDDADTEIRSHVRNCCAHRSVAPPGGARGGASPLWVDVQKLCNMCVLSLSRNFFVSHDKYIARPSSKEPR